MHVLITSQNSIKAPARPPLADLVFMSSTPAIFPEPRRCREKEKSPARSNIRDQLMKASPNGGFIGPATGLRIFFIGQEPRAARTGG